MVSIRHFSVVTWKLNLISKYNVQCTEDFLVPKSLQHHNVSSLCHIFNLKSLITLKENLKPKTYNSATDCIINYTIARNVVSRCCMKGREDRRLHYVCVQGMCGGIPWKILPQQNWPIRVLVWHCSSYAQDLRPSFLSRRCH